MPGHPAPHGHRVVVLLSQLSGVGGIQRYNRLLCRSLLAYQRERGVELDVISLNDAAGWLDSEILSRPITGCNRRRPLFVAKAVQALLRPYSLVLVGHVDLGPIAVFPQCLRPSARMVTVVHGEEVWRTIGWAKRLALRSSNIIWAVSAYTKAETVRRHQVAATKIEVVPNALDPMFTDGVQSNLGRPIHTRLLTISRLSASSPGKGVDKLISAMPAILARIPDADLTVVGGGDDLPRLNNLAASLGLGTAVNFMGEISDAELQTYLRGAEVFVLPSRREGFGIVFLEAMAYAKPVIAGAHGGSPEVVVDGVTGRLVTYGDEPSLVAAVTALLHDPHLRRQMGEAGADRVRALYTYDRFRDSVFAMLNRLLGRPDDSPAPV
jgi:phosphatidyl-myo-inositol dimannoside synthase